MLQEERCQEIIPESTSDRLIRNLRERGLMQVLRSNPCPLTLNLARQKSWNESDWPSFIKLAILSVILWANGQLFKKRFSKDTERLTRPLATIDEDNDLHHGNTHSNTTHSLSHHCARGCADQEGPFLITPAKLRRSDQRCCQPFPNFVERANGRDLGFNSKLTLHS